MTRLLPLALAAMAAPAFAQTPPHDHTQHAPPQQQQEPAPPPAPADPHAQHQQPAPAPQGQPPAHQGHTMNHDGHMMNHDGHMMDHDGRMQMGHGQHGEGHAAQQMTGAYGPYPGGRDSSGTAWQPDAASHGGVHAMAGGWMLMGHAEVSTINSWQDGPRGDEKAFVAGMFMGEARRDLANGDNIGFRAMLSPDPFMGKRGYPLLLAAGETADGVDTLVDRQHPHDLFMELSARYTKRLSDTGSAFLYVGLPGEPAFGPPAYMHRPAAQESPEAPITHHWLDSTHITFGVVTAGWIEGGFKLEASRFRGREPDQDRYDIETGGLDSTAVRVSWNPDANWSLQASWADVTSPEQLEPDVDVEKWSASALFTKQYGFGEVSASAAFGRKEPTHGEALDAWLGEASWRPSGSWTVFARGEAIETDELGPGGHHGGVEDVAKLSIGAVHDWTVAEHVKLGVGALAARNWTSEALDPLYGGDPWGGMAFVRLRIG